MFPNVTTTFTCAKCNYSFDENTQNVVINLEKLKIVDLGNLNETFEDYKILTLQD